MNWENAKVVEQELVKSGILFLSEEVDDDSAKDIVQSIIYLNKLTSKKLDKITIVINSVGGSAFGGFGIIDVMKGSKLPVHTVGSGLLASASLLIFMAGECGHRYITENSFLLSHRFSDFNVGNYSDLIANRVQQDRLHDTMVNFYIENSNLKTKKEVEKEVLKDTDVWLTPDDALKFGIADTIVKSEELPI